MPAAMDTWISYQSSLYDYAVDLSREAKEKMEQRKLSDILIEIAMQGLKNPSSGHYDVMHPLMWLAHVAWNREVRDPGYMQAGLSGYLSGFDIQESVLRRELISEDWTKILDRMRTYKKARFPEDFRFITLCAYTRRGTLRVEFE